MEGQAGTREPSHGTACCPGETAMGPERQQNTWLSSWTGGVGIESAGFGDWQWVGIKVGRKS